MPKPGSIVLKGAIQIDWKAPELNLLSSKAGRDAVEEILIEARDLARERVARGQGPGPHPHRTDTGYEWEDTGKLMDAIHVQYNWQGELVAPSGVAAGNLIVDPIDYGDGRGPLPTGFFLEFGFTPIIVSEGRKRRGYFTRYPFLGPAIDEAARDIPQRVRKMFRQGQDLVARRASKKSVFVETTIDSDNNQPKNKFTALQLGAN